MKIGQGKSSNDKNASPFSRLDLTKKKIVELKRDQMQGVAGATTPSSTCPQFKTGHYWIPNSEKNYNGMNGCMLP